MPRISHRIIPSAIAGAKPMILSFYNYFAPHKYEGTPSGLGKKRFGMFTNNHSYGCKKAAFGGRK